MKELFLVRSTYRHCFVGVMMRPSGYFKSHLALSEIWVRDPWSTV